MSAVPIVHPISLSEDMDQEEIKTALRSIKTGDTFEIRVGRDSIWKLDNVLSFHGLEEVEIRPDELPRLTDALVCRDCNHFDCHLKAGRRWDCQIFEMHMAPAIKCIQIVS